MHDSYTERKNQASKEEDAEAKKLLEKYELEHPDKSELPQVPPVDNNDYKSIEKNKTNISNEKVVSEEIKKLDMTDK